MADSGLTRARSLADRGAFAQASEVLAEQPEGPERWLREGQLALRAGDDPLPSLSRIPGSGAVGAVLRDGLLGLAAVHALRGAPATAREYALQATKRDGADGVARHLAATLGNQGAETPLHGEVKSLFDDYALFYDHHLVEVLQYAGPKLVGSALVKHGGDDLGLVVDLGCGTGLCGPAVSMFCDHLVGVDLSAEMVAQCAKVEGYAAVWQDDAVHALRGFLQGGVDAIVAGDVVGYVRDVEALFAEARRALAAGGVLVFSVESWAGAGDVAMSASRRLAFAPDYLRRVASEVGLELVALDESIIRHEAGEPVSGMVVTLRAE